MALYSPTHSPQYLDKNLQLITEIGKGGQGYVYLVLDTITNEYLAAKVIKPELNRPSKSSHLLLSREAEAMPGKSVPEHPNIVKSRGLRLYEEEEEGVSYHLMEYAQNETLLRYFKA